MNSSLLRGRYVHHTVCKRDGCYDVVCISRPHHRCSEAPGWYCDRVWCPLACARADGMNMELGFKTCAQCRKWHINDTVLLDTLLSHTGLTRNDVYAMRRHTQDDANSE